MAGSATRRAGLLALGEPASPPWASGTRQDPRGTSPAGLYARASMNADPERQAGQDLPLPGTQPRPLIGGLGQRLRGDLHPAP